MRLRRARTVALDRPPGVPDLVFRSVSRTHTGVVRENNEDSCFAGAHLLAVADGVGGNVGGEVASRTVIDTIAYLDDDIVLPDMAKDLREAVGYANVRVAEVVERDQPLQGMATTLTAVQLQRATLGIAHIGDSRAYRARAGELQQITRDDSLVQDLVDQGEITAEQARTHPQRSVIVQAIGGGRIRPTVELIDAHEGDRYLLCTDGLSDCVSQFLMTELLTLSSLDDCADALVSAALEAGAQDNVTFVVGEVAAASSA